MCNDRQIVRAGRKTEEESGRRDGRLPRGINVKKVILMRGTRSPLYLVVTDNQVTLAELQKSVHTIQFTKITWERRQNNRQMIQCRRCQKWGHAKVNCGHPPCCVKCAGPHYTHECPHTRDEEGFVPKCANCEGEHTACNPESPVYQNRLQQMQPREEPPPAPQRGPEYSTHSGPSSEAALTTSSSENRSSRSRSRSHYSTGKRRRHWDDHPPTPLPSPRQHAIPPRTQLVVRRYNERRIAAGGVAGVAPEDRVGKAYVLPVLFEGGNRGRQRRYLDAMSVIARHSKPDLFITFTCNPNWPEIVAGLEGNQRWQDRPDLVCRVFKRKLDEFIDDIVHKQLYGVVLNYSYVIEFQKRGLPHAHIVVTLVADDRLEDAEAVDRVISAVIPDRETAPRLYRIVVRHQLHSSSVAHDENAPCMVEAEDGRRRCSKAYPRDFREETALNMRRASGMPEYRRPMDGRTVEMGDRVLNNRWVVPYNPYASAKYDCHINFEVCGSLLSMKYLHKYVHKGGDMVEVEIAGRGDGDGERRVRVIDEIKEYVEGRWVSAMEATWRLFEFKMHDRSHAVMVLPVHLPGEDEVLFEEDDGDDQEEFERRLGAPTKLEAWFALNREDPEARRYKYVEIPDHYTWSRGAWHPRRQVAKLVGCVVEHVRGATSFEHLKQVGDVRCDTFQEVCRLMNLLENVDEFDLCLGEAALKHHPRRFRKIFGLICCLVVDENNPAEIGRLWRKYRGELTEDFRQQGVGRREALRLAAAEVRAVVERNRGADDWAAFGIGVDDDEEEEEEEEVGDRVRREAAAGVEEDAGD
ncbi:hypothetical protein NQ318_007484 [Aromia moschata]|uniref:Helitron helicase-like domain-containing protein n=1 Tax=Aromia moschata TaxID=1265417 RepID=A0AAV8YEC2_9CUCU|nr:hypothetical protein NQ318_007484 [Aromia moschata]